MWNSHRRRTETFDIRLKSTSVIELFSITLSGSTSHFHLHTWCLENLVSGQNNLTSLVFIVRFPVVTEREAWQVTLASCALRFLESARPHATYQRLVARNLQSAAAFVQQEDATARPFPRSIHCRPSLISLWFQEIRCCGFTDRDQEIPLVREYIDTVLATRITAGKWKTVPLRHFLFFWFVLHLLLSNNLYVICKILVWRKICS